VLANDRGVIRLILRQAARQPRAITAFAVSGFALGVAYLFCRQLQNGWRRAAVWSPSLTSRPRFGQKYKQGQLLPASADTPSANSLTSATR